MKPEHKHKNRWDAEVKHLKHQQQMIKWRLRWINDQAYAAPTKPIVMPCMSRPFENHPRGAALREMSARMQAETIARHGAELPVRDGCPFEQDNP